MKKTTSKYVIIGNSAAAIGAVEGIRQVDTRGRITILTDESHHTYSRPLISYLLNGKATEQTMKYRPDSFYDDNKCTLKHSNATKIDAKARCVTLADGSSITFEKLLIATGASAHCPQYKGLETVTSRHRFMTLDDARGLEAVLGSDKRVLIIGAGLIALKCAEGVIGRAASVTVLARSRILSSILDEDGAAIVSQHLVSRGVDLRTGTSVVCFEGNTAVLSNDEKLEFDVLVLAVGVRPNVELLQGIAEIDRAIVVNAKSETTAIDIYAAGDCTQTLDASSGEQKPMAILPTAYMQGETAGINMASTTADTVTFDKAIPMNAIGFFGLHIITAGNYNGQMYMGESTDAGCYKRLFFSNNKLNGYILIGDVEKAGIYTSLVREGTPLDTLDFALICEKPGLMAFSKNERETKLGGAAQ